MQYIRGRNEHDLRKVIFDIEVMIMECVVLFGIEDLEQGSRRVTPEIRTELVDLIEQNQRIDRRRPSSSSG